MDQGGIDVLVRIEPKYVVPKTRRGVDVQSPLEIMNPITPSQSTSRPHWARGQRGQNSGRGAPSSEISIIASDTDSGTSDNDGGRVYHWRHRFLDSARNLATRFILEYLNFNGMGIRPIIYEKE